MALVALLALSSVQADSVNPIEKVTGGQSMATLMLLLSDFNLSGGCFGTEIIQNCMKWSNIGVHGLRLGPIEAEFQGASFLIQQNAEK